MTARRRRGRARPGRLVAVGLVLLVLLVVAEHAWALLTVALAGTLAVAAVAVDRRYVRGRATPTRPAARPSAACAKATRPDAQAHAHAEALERARYAAEAERTIADLRAQLADARASASAAWDAAAERPPSPPRPRPMSAREGLLGAPLSGARPLIGGDQ